MEKNSLLKIEIGAGERPTPGYLQQDIAKLPGVKYDFICNPWEIDVPYNSVKEVIALGVVEHLRFKEVELLLKHLSNILVRGGGWSFYLTCRI